MKQKDVFIANCNGLWVSDVNYTHDGIRLRTDKKEATRISNKGDIKFIRKYFPNADFYKLETVEVLIK